MKLTIIGGGGVRSLFLAKSLAQKAESLGITSLCFMDNNAKKLSIYGGMAKWAVNLLAPSVAFTLTSDAVEAVTDADYVITTIRAGGDIMRVKDERIPLGMGLIGQETTGAAGFSFAMRSIPVLINYMELVKKYAKKGCKVFNFTNPAGLVSQALRDLGYDFTYGICDAPSGLISQIAELYGYDKNGLDAECFGLNHLSFITSLNYRGKDIIKDVLNDDAVYEKTEMRFFSREFALKRGCLINEYLYYYYYPEKAVANILNAGKTRGEVIAEINAGMTEELSAYDIGKDLPSAIKIFEKWYARREDSYMSNETGLKKEHKWSFDLYAKDSGGYAGVALRFIELERSEKAGDMILCVPDGGASDGFLKESDVAEITCTVTGGKAVPHKQNLDNLPEAEKELIRRVKCYEREAARAIINKDKYLATEALFMHPLINSYSLAERLTDEILKLNKDFSDGWK